MSDEFVVRAKGGKVFFIDFRTKGLIRRERYVSLTNVHNGEFVITCIGDKSARHVPPPEIEEKDVKNSRGKRIFVLV